MYLTLDRSVIWWVRQSCARTNQYACVTVMNFFASGEAMSVLRIYFSNYACLMANSTGQSLVA